MVTRERSTDDNRTLLNKQEIRALCRDARNRQSEETQREKSREICRILADTPIYQESTVLFAYIATQKEVDLRLLIEDAWNHGKTVAVPRVEGQDMNFYRITSWEDLEEGSFHILEPKRECEPVNTDQPALFLAPGVAFDEKGHRIGYGGGFYDRYLAEHPNYYTIGVGYAFQLLPQVPFEETDRPMNEIVIEDGILQINVL